MLVRWWTVAVSTVLAGACAPPLRPGQRLNSAVATLETEATVVETLDHRRAGEVSTIELLPGRHSVGIRLREVQHGMLVTEVAYSRGSVTICFTARPGRRYRSRPAFIGHGRWRPEIIDTTNQTVVKSDLCYNE